MPSDPQPTSQDSPQRMPVDGTTPVRTRSGVRTLLGMPESAVAAVLSPVPMPPLEFSYVMSPSSAERHAPDQALADELLYAAPDGEPWSDHEGPPDSIPVRQQPAQPGPRPEPTMLHAPEAQPLASAQPEPEPPQRPSPVAGPMRQNAMEMVTSLEEETIALEEIQAGASASVRHTTITIPGITERRHATPVYAPADRAQPLSGAIPGGSQDTGVEAGQPHSHVEEPSAEGQTALPPGHSIDTMLAVVDVAERLQRAESRTVRPAVMPPTDSMEHSLAEAERGSSADPPSTPQQPVLSPIGSPLAGADTSGGNAPTPTGSPITDGSVVPGPVPTASGITAPVSTSASGNASSAVAPHAPVAGVRAGMHLSSTNPALPRTSEQSPSLRPVSPELASPAAVVSLPVAQTRPEVDSSGSISPPMRNTVEQIAQLQRTVTELAAQVAAQQAEQQANLQGESMFPPPAQPVVIVERATPPARTPRAFWERSYLSRLSRWPRR
jgi:hypothetical protein